MTNRNNISRHYTKWGYIFVLPFLVIYLAFNFYPLMCTIWYAFCDLRGRESTGPTFLPSIGEPWFRNFLDIFCVFRLLQMSEAVSASQNSGLLIEMR